MTDHLLLRLKEAAELLAVSEPTIRRYIETAGLPAVQMPSGRGETTHLRIRRTDLNAWVDGLRTTEPGSGMPAFMRELLK